MKYRNPWSATSGSASPITNNTAVTMRGTPSASDIANGLGSTIYLTDLEIQNSSATVATVVNILGKTSGRVLASFYCDTIAASHVSQPQGFHSITPLQVPAGDDLQIQAVTTGANIYWNARGFTANPG